MYGSSSGLTLDTNLAVRDELASDRKDLIREQRDVKRLRDRDPVAQDVEDRLVASLDGKNRSSIGEEHRVVDQMRSTQVGSHSDILNNTSGRRHRRDVVKCIAEVERTVGNRLVTEGLDCGLYRMTR